MTDFEVDQEVRVIDSGYLAERSGMPPGGWPGVIVKITAKQVHIKYGDIGRVDIFDRQSQRIRHGEIARRFRTLPQAEEQDRRHAAMAVLRKHGIKVEETYDHRFALEQIEALAEVVKTWED